MKLDNLEKFGQLIELQKNLSSLNNSDLEEEIKKFKESVFMNDTEKIPFFVSEIIAVAKIRPANLIPLSRVIRELIEHDEKMETRYPSFKELFISKCFDVTDDNKCLEYSNVFHLLRYCCENGIISIKEIRSKIVDFSLAYKNTLFILFSYFAHYLNDYDSDAVNIIQYKLRNIKFSVYSIHQIIDNFDSYQKFRWEKMMIVTEYGWENSSIGRVLKYDSKDELQEMISADHSLCSKQLMVSPFENIMMYSYVTPLQLCGFYGSVNCFKFLMLNESPIGNITKFVVAGGNVELIKICQNMEPKFDEFLSYAIQYRRYEVVEWIICNYTINFSDLINALVCCCSFDNIVTLVYILQNTDINNINEVNQYGDTCLHAAARNNYEYCVRFLLSCTNCQTNIQDWNGLTPDKLTTSKEIVNLITTHRN